VIHVKRKSSFLPKAPLTTGHLDLSRCSMLVVFVFDPNSVEFYWYSNLVDHPSVQGTGSVSGHLAQDRVAMGGLTVDRQDLGIITSQDDALAGSPTSGLIGMAFSNVAVSQKPTFFENLMKGDKLSAEMFSVHLARNQVSGSEVCVTDSQVCYFILN
jgi:Eukaryotic aspartyl protease